MTAITGMVDATHASVPDVPDTVVKVALYVTGTPDVQCTTADRDKFRHSAVVTIDQSPDGAWFGAGRADVFDVEPRAGTDAAAEAKAARRQASVSAVKQRQAGGFDSTIYVDQSSLPDLRARLAADKDVRLNKVAFWVADWSLNEHEAADQLGNDIVAIQWASPLSNPDTLVPGSHLTLAQANVDLSVTLASWYPRPDVKPAPVPRVKHHRVRKVVKRARRTVKKQPVKTATGTAGALIAAVELVFKHIGIHLTATEAHSIVTAIPAIAALISALAARPVVHSVIQGALMTVGAAAATFGAGATPAQTATYLPLASVILGYLTAHDVTPVAKEIQPAAEPAAG
jgi:hypothetical protein